MCVFRKQRPQIDIPRTIRCLTSELRTNIRAHLVASSTDSRSEMDHQLVRRNFAPHKLRESGVDYSCSRTTPPRMKNRYSAGLMSDEYGNAIRNRYREG